MTVIDLEKLEGMPQHRMDSLLWLYSNIGPAGDEWDISELRYVRFKHSQHATDYLLRWAR